MFEILEVSGEHEKSHDPHAIMWSQVMSRDWIFSFYKVKKAL